MGWSSVFNRGRQNLSVDQPVKSGRRALQVEVGAGGVRYMGGIVDSDEFNAKLTGRDAIEMYDKMRRTDAQVSAVLNTCWLPILGATWIIDRPQDDEEESAKITDEHLEFARHNLFTRIDFPGLLRHAMSCLWAGFSWSEKVYELVGGQLLLLKVAPRLASTVKKWHVDGSGNLTGLQQEVYKDGSYQTIDIARDKIVHWAYGQEANNYEGMSLLRAIYKHWLIKDTLYRIDAIRAERFAVGVPCISMPEDYDQDLYDMAVTIGKNWKGAEQSYVVKVQGMEIELLQVKGGEALDLTKTIQHHNEEIGKAALTQFINFGTTASGSRALGETATQFFYDAEVAWSHELAETISRDIIWPTMDLNFPDSPRPRLFCQDIGSVGLAELSATLRDVGNTFVTPDLPLENAIRKKLSLPLRTQEQVDEAEEEEAEKAPESPVVPLPEQRPGQQVAPEEQAPPATAAASHAHLSMADQAVRSEGEFWRPLRPIERHIALRQISGMMDDSGDRILRTLLAARDQWVPYLTQYATVMYGRGPDGLEAIGLPQQDEAKVTAQVVPILEDVYVFGEEQVRRELESQAREAQVALGRRKEVRRKDEFRRQHAAWFRDDMTVEEAAALISVRSHMMVTRLMAKTEEAARLIAIETYRTVGPDSLTPADIEAMTTEILSSVEQESKLAARTVVAEALNLGRDAAADRLIDQIRVAQYSAILDGNSCLDCSRADGFEAQVGTPEYYDATPPLRSRKFGTCDGKSKCRCIWTYILKIERNQEERQ